MSDEGRKMFDAGVRVERVIWLPGATCADTPPDDLKDFLESLDDDATNYIYTVVPELAQTVGAELDIELCVELLVYASGFLVQGAAPVRSYHDGGAYYSGWGHYRTRWFRVASADEISPTVIAWAEECAEADHAKSEVSA